MSLLERAGTAAKGFAVRMGGNLIGGGDFDAAAIPAMMDLVREISAGAEFAGPPAPPAFLLPVLDLVAAERELPPPLLYAVAGVLTSYDIEHAAGESLGVMGARRTRGGELLAAEHGRPTWDALRARDAAALRLVVDDVREGVQQLVELRQQTGNWVSALAEYSDRRAACEIVGAFLLFTLHNVKGTI
jgi:hypothetical protein